MKCVNRSVTLIWGKTAEIIEQCFCRHDGRWTHVSVVCVLSHDSPCSTGSWPACGSAGSCRRRRIRTDRRRRKSECTRTWSDPSAWQAKPRSEPSEESRTSSGPPNTPHTPDHVCTGRLQTAADASKHTCHRPAISAFYSLQSNIAIWRWWHQLFILFISSLLTKRWCLFVLVAFDTELNRFIILNSISVFSDNMIIKNEFYK